MCAMAIGAAALLPLVQSSIATSTNGNLDRLERERDDWRTRVQERELDVATAAGLDHIEKVARKDLKMVEPVTTRYITVPVAPPEPLHVPDRYLHTADTEQEDATPIWEEALNLLKRLPLP